jgi:tetratricopeptide (TPR) repeat protein
MGKILPFPPKQPSKFGFVRVKNRKKEIPDQLNLFVPMVGQVLHLPTYTSPFEEALLLDEHNDSRAEEAYWRAISEGDHVADAYCNLGIIESKAGKTVKAFDCLTKSLECDSRHLEAHYNLGNLYFDAENLRLARMHYELIAEIDPTFPNVYFNLGLVLVLLEQQNAAIDAFVKYRLLAPQEECSKADNLISELKRSLSASGRNTRP